MSLKFLSRPAIAVAASALGLVLSLPAEAGPRAGSGARPAAAQPRAPHAHGVPRGDYERETVRTRTDNGYTSNTQFTGPNGSGSRDVVVARDREAGTSTRDAAWSLPDGRTATSHTLTTRTADGFERSTTATGPNGNTGTRSVVVSRDPVTGTVTTNVTQNGGANPNGG